MEEEAAQELGGGQSHHPLFAAVSIVLPTKSDTFAIECEKPMIGDGDPIGRDSARPSSVLRRLAWHKPPSPDGAAAEAVDETVLDQPALELAFAPTPDIESTWGSMAARRDELLRDAEQLGPTAADELKEQLDRLGPLGLWRETARSYLQDHSFVQASSESFAETMARALGLGMSDFETCLAQGRIGNALLNRFGSAE